MSEQSGNKTELRKYLLGVLDLDADREKIDEQLLLDKKYLEELFRQEEELIQAYADGELMPDEQKAFEEFFLISDERRQKLKFARALRKYVDKKDKIIAEEQTGEKRSFAEIFKSFFTSPLPAASLAIIIFASIFVWYLSFRSSAAELAVNSLNQVYRQNRPLETRITDFDYAPFYKTRSEQEENLDIDERDRAELSLRNEIKRYPTAENFHALGRLYLAKKDFDKAIEELEKAKALESKDAGIFNDLGVAYLEKYKTQANDQNSKDSELFIEALDFFNKAIELDPKLLEAYFNRADCLQISNLQNEAGQAWKKYLEFDSTSPWAAEARRRLEILESKTSVNMSADQLEEAFLRAYDQKNDDQAFYFASQNRELISEQYLPQRLSISIVNSEPAQRAERIKALRYLGDLEKKRIGDDFASDLAVYYSQISDDKIELLKKAQAAVREGYQICLYTNKFDVAKDKFKIAGDFFLQAGNFIEAKTVSDYFIAYCLYYLDRLAADKMLKEIAEFCSRKNYRWFALMNYYWWLGSQEYLGYKTITETRSEYETAFENARNMGDFYMMQKFLTSLLLKSNQVKQEREAFSYLKKLLDLSTEQNLSVRQKTRGLDKIIKVLSNTRYTGFSAAVVRESVALARTETDPSFVIAYEINAGIVNTQIRNFEEAEQMLFSARQKAENLPEEPLRITNLTNIFLKLGDLETKRDNLLQAENYYNNALELAGKTDNLSLLYDIKKARLITFRALGNEDQIEREIPSIMQLADNYRTQITAEQERISFFDSEQPVYDIAIENEARRNRFEQAYDYAEHSSARSLLDSMVKVSESGFSEPSIPLTIGQIRENMPPQVQILQFYLLDDKVLIWLVSKESFLTFSSAIDSAELKKKVENYLKLIEENKPENQDKIAETAREFYNLLIQPAHAALDKSKQICLIPNKVLFRLPFPALISPDKKYFLEEFTFFYSPSANVFIDSTKNAGLKGEIKEEKLLSVGNPAFDKQRFPKLAMLPESKTEALEIRKNFAKAQELTELNATKQAFLSLYKNFEVIHFAGHYIVDDNSPLLSKLVMAKSGENADDAFLTNRELRDEKLPLTRLVVLAACQTGVEGYYNGEGLVGLSRTFLAAGVPLVVASAWRVESEATSLIMKKFHYYRQQKKLSTTESLRQAQLDMLRENSGRFQSVYFWSAYSVFGGYAEF